MSDRPRVAKVLAALLVSMTTGAIVLMALGNNAPSAGPFCLSSYWHLDPVQKTISSQAARSPDRWDCIEIYYSGTKAGNIRQLASVNGIKAPEDINCHFVICNGLGGDDGRIMSTEKWKRQWSVIPNQTWYGSGTTIRVCVIGDGSQSPATDAQVKRVDALVEALHHEFNITTESIYYPSNWR